MKNIEVIDEIKEIIFHLKTKEYGTIIIQRGDEMSVHLHVRSCYTLLESTLTISKIVKRAKMDGYSTVALTDKQVMHGAMAFHHACKDAGIHPVYGMEVNTKQGEDSLGFILLAKNDQGYQDLLKLSTILNTQERNQIATMEELVGYTHDCFVLTAGDSDSLEEAIIKENNEKIMSLLTQMKELFSSLFISIARNDSGLLKLRNPQLRACARQLAIPCVALSRICYEQESDEESYKTLCAIRQGVTIHDKTLNYSKKRYFRSREEMDALYEAEDLIHTDEIAQQCQVKMQFPKAILPKFKNRYGVSSEDFLRTLCHKGLEKRMEYHTIPKEYEERLQYELNVIISMQYADYFLIVWDFIRFAKTQNIFIGPGRGSAAGSLVAYCLGITHVDPIKYQLLFERFLNPERISMPDIDTDFPDDRRDEVIQYVRRVYGDQRVSHIITFNTLAAKQVLRDVGKAMEIPLRQIDILCKLVPYRTKITLEQAYEEQARFKQMINSGEQMKKLFAISKQLEGLPRHASLHAAGIVFSDEDISHVCPLIDVDQGMSATQFTMEYLEELGLIKMDFLGLRNLTIIDEIVQQINHDSKRIDIMKIPLDDKKTFDLICAVDTVGVFQLESEGMKNLIRQMKPHNFEDVVATIALFRPGPMENIPEYLARRAKPETIDYIHPNLEPILKHTYGIMIYQEQIMQVAQKMAGFSLGKADNLRKAISKKKGNELIKLQEDFIQGALQLGYDYSLAKKVYDLIMKFANYGFGRAHSVAYGMIAYQLAYLKANAPLYFFMALLNSIIGAEGKTSEYIFEAKKRQIQILSPSINHSTMQYIIYENALIFPLLGIKGMGKAVCEEIIEEREIRGSFTDFFDFVARMIGRRIGRKTFELLIFSGAMDEFHLNRSSLNASLDDAMRYGDLVKIEDQNQVLFDFDIVSKPLVTSIHENMNFRAEREKEALGFYLSNHPIAMLRERIDASLEPLSLMVKKRGYVRFICTIERIRQHRTKHGDLMLFAVGSDETAKFDLVCMPNIYQAHQEDLVKGSDLYIEGIIDKENSCLVKKITCIEKEK